MKSKYWFVFFILIAVLVIGACSSKEEAKVEGSSANNDIGGQVGAEDLDDTSVSDDNALLAQDSPLDGIIPQDPGATALPIINGVEGGLLIVGDETLAYARFDGELVTLIHEEVNPFTVEVLPQNRVGFIGRQSDGGRGESVYIYDLDLGEMNTELELNAGGAIVGWSDDGSWLSIGEFQNNAQVIVMSTDGSFRSEDISNGFDMAWMTDNTAMFLVRDPDDSFNPFALRHYDPTTDTTTDLDIPVVQGLNVNVATFEAELAALGYLISDAYLHFDRQDENNEDRWFIALPDELATNNQVLCETWNVFRFNREDGSDEIIIGVEVTHRLSDINLLPDGSALLLRWYREGCAISSALQAELLRISPDGNSTVVVDNVLVDSNSVQNFNLDRRYTVSSNGRYVIWASQAGNTLQDPAIDMIDLETGSQLRLFTQAEGENAVIHSVTWVD